MSLIGGKVKSINGIFVSKKTFHHSSKYLIPISTIGNVIHVSVSEIPPRKATMIDERLDIKIKLPVNQYHK